MYNFSDIRVVHLELTERCNAACPQCPRRIDGGPLNEKLTMAELSLADIRQLLPESFVQKLGKIYLCGNYGDPAAARDTLGVMAYFRGVNPTLRLGLHSNGSLRDTAFWAELARIIGDHGYVRFAIDGLEDTNHIYRRNTDWAKIMANVAAFVAAGGKAEWDFLVFAHNEHQVEAARTLAEKIGFVAFNVKKTNRFLSRQNKAYAAATPVRNTAGAAVAVLERPQQSVYQNDALQNLATESAGFTTFDAYLNTRTIHCKAQQEKSLYISAEGKIFPCCWLGQMIKNPDGGEVADAERRFGPFFADASLDGKMRTVEAIVKDTFFQEEVPHAWTSPKIKVCARVCGT